MCLAFYISFIVIMRLYLLDFYILKDKKTCLIDVCYKLNPIDLLVLLKLILIKGIPYQHAS